MRLGVNFLYVIILKKLFKNIYVFKEKKTSKLWLNHFRFIDSKIKFIRIYHIITYYKRVFEKTSENISKYKIANVTKQSSYAYPYAYMLGAIGTFVFDWDRERVTLSLVDSLLKEHEYCNLNDDLSICNNCNSKIELCKCLKRTDFFPIDLNIFKFNNSWEPFLSGDEIKIWRKEEKPTFYSYRVYAKYDDITSYDFLQVQTDIQYRKQWDDTVARLEIVEADPINELSHVIYWEMRWPKLFKNRDYVYCRRVFFDHSRNCVIICNKSTTHPRHPIYPEKQRVQEYWSYMIIKPFTDSHKPGMEFILVYFDNPGLNIPSTLSSWMAQKQMPEFLDKLHNATQKFAERKTHFTKIYND